MEEIEYNEDEKMLLDLLGLELYCEVCKLVGGRRIYLSQRHEKHLRNQHIIQRFRVILETGKNVDMKCVYKKLAEEYGLSIDYVEKIVNGRT